MALTTISESGSVAIPEEVREAFGWIPGTELEILAQGREVVLRPKEEATGTPPSITMKEFLARVPRYEGPPVTQEMMDAAVLEEARRRWHAKGG